MATSDRHHPTEAADNRNNSRSSGCDGLPSADLTTSQRLIWAGQTFSPDVPLYNMALAFTIEGEIRPKLFHDALQTLVDRCDALRAVFDAVNGRPRQYVLTQLAAPHESLDFSDLPGPDDTIRACLSDRTQRQFDLRCCSFDSALIRVDTKRYVWYLNQHHLTTDAWSVSVLYRRMQEFYRLAREQRLADAPTLPSYLDYVAYERDHRSSSSCQRAVAYWGEALKLPLTPTNFYGTKAQKCSPRTDRVTHDLGSQRSLALRELARKPEFRSLTNELSRMQLFASLLFAYLYRMTGNRNLSIGTPAHNRSTADFRETVGLFVEIFPLRVEIEDNETFVSLFRKVAAKTRELLVHAQPGGSSSQHNRAFDVLLNYIPSSFSEFDGMPMKSEWIHSGYGDLHHSLRLQVHDFDQSDRFLLHFDLHSDVFCEPQRDWVIRHFDALIDGLLRSPNQAIHRVSLLSPDEYQRIVIEFNQREPDAGRVQTVTDLFEQQVKKTPDAVALTCGGEKVTYDQLNQRANQLAHVLRAQGVGRDEVVAVCARRSVDTVAALLGTMKAGAAYVPIDPAYPAGRISFLVGDTRAKLVLTQKDLAPLFSDQGLSVIALDGDCEAIDQHISSNLKSRPDAEDMAYVIYTSGSTGQPKGVMVTHRGLTHYVGWAKSYYLDGEVFDFPLYSSLAFDLTVTSIYVPLIAGGRVVIYPDELNSRDILIRRVMEDDAVDIVKLTPSHLALLRDMDLRSSRVKKLILGGEELKTELARQLHTQFAHNVEIYNEYGPTEATVGCMIHRYDPTEDCGGSVPIGHPAACARIYLLDSDGAVVPHGVTGEICIGGPTVARGYWNRPELTEEKFKPGPFDTQDRLYHSGDLARWNENERLELLGRRDHQVKVRGVRVELGEVESALLQHDDIQECVVVADSVPDAHSPVQPVQHCTACGLESTHPMAKLDEDGVCKVCRSFEQQRDLAGALFGSMDDLRDILQHAKDNRTGPYDCIALLSGGKDSTYVLYQLVDMGLDVLAFTLDNGYISDGAMANIRRVVDSLEVDWIVGSTPAMNEIFVDSLQRFSNVCNGCFKTIYTLAVNLANEKGVKCIVTGLSRGQLFETRFADLLNQRICDPIQIDQTILEARKTYHRLDDAVTRNLDVVVFEDDNVLDEIRFVDFYRYCDDTLEDILGYLGTHGPWMRPTDTGRSTNCLINDVGIYVHKKERGFHNYALPYSWDVRLGHKERDAALQELDDDIDVESTHRILDEIGYQLRTPLDDRDGKRLVVYYVSRQELTPSQLRQFLGNTLPEEIVPSCYVPLGKLPLTPNGKIDRDALPNANDTGPRLNNEFVAPEGPIESTMASVWSEVLGVQRVGIHDNFFDLGGDSILNIQIVSRLRPLGVSLTPQQLFDHPTIGELAAAVKQMNVRRDTTRVVDRPVPVTPIQQCFLQESESSLQPYSQAVLLDLSIDLDPSRLESALTSLILHHEALRLQFDGHGGRWQQRVLAADLSPSLARIDLSRRAADECDAAIGETLARLHEDLVASFPMLRAAWFKMPDDRPDRLVLVAHHLCVDGVSWWILLEDLETAYQQLAGGRAIQLPPRTTSFTWWAESLAKYAQTPELASELDYWLSHTTIVAESAVEVRKGMTEPAPVTRTVSTSLDRDETQSLLHEVPSVYHTQVMEVLLAALAESFGRHGRRQTVRLDIETHGRHEILGDVDLHRTVGWFTSVFPFLLGTEQEATPGQRLLRIKEQFRGVPRHGIGYGLLRHLCRDASVANRLSDSPIGDVLLNYMGVLDKVLAQSKCFRFARPIIALRSPTAAKFNPLEINAYVFDGRIHIDWRDDRDLDEGVSVEQLAEQFLEALRELINHCLRSGGDGNTPLDFPQANLGQAELDELIAEFGDSGGD